MDDHQIIGLPRALDHLGRIAADRWEGPAVLVGFEGDIDGPLLPRPEPLTGHPAEVLLGRRAPASWTAVGLLSYGWASHPDDWDEMHVMPGIAQGPPISTRRNRRRVRTSVVYDRRGRSAGRFTIAPDVVHDNPEPPVGRIPDTLRRMLQLPTDPPPCGTAQLVLFIWVMSILRRAERRTTPLSWTEVTSLHPGRTLVGEHLDVVAATRILDRRLTWDVVRRVARRGAMTSIVPADHAAWMDAGMLSREVISTLPPLEAMVAMLGEAVTSGVARRIERVARAAVAEGWTADEEPGVA